MGHKCDLCDREATVHEVVVRNGEGVERHLCQQHAEELGVVGATSHSGVAGVVQSVVLAKSGVAGQRAESAATCPGCGLRYGEFRKEGLLGCARCYETFATRLAPLLERAHEGGAHHSGKAPARAGTSIERQARMTELRKSLQQAIEHERYEEAAKIRDRIAQLESSCGAAPALGESGDAEA